jgi:hypothetical protein
MTDVVCEAVCPVTEPAPRTGSGQVFLEGCAEICTEAFRKVGESLGAQVQAGLKAVAAGVGAAASRDASEFRARLAESWREGLEGLRPVYRAQLEAYQFAAALALHVAAGMRVVSTEVYERRLAVCAACEFFRDNHCLQCGCRLGGELLAKARWAGERCPLGKW